MTYVLILVYAPCPLYWVDFCLHETKHGGHYLCGSPHYLLLTLMFLMASFFWLVFGVICFIGGSFYGLGQWWWPKLFEVLDFNGDFIIQPIITGRWE
jgi:hypothetical protein